MSGELITRASVDDKLARYLLNPDHPLGSEKARFFERVLGFHRQNAEGLARQLVFDPAAAVFLEENAFGERYGQMIRVTGSNDRSTLIQMIWIRNQDGFVRLVTAYPGD